jgi:hypothetical protein
MLPRALAPSPGRAEESLPDQQVCAVNFDNIPANSVPLVSAQHELTNPRDALSLHLGGRPTYHGR